MATDKKSVNIKVETKNDRFKIRNYTSAQKKALTLRIKQALH